MCLLIDEAQNVRGDAAIDVLEVLHKGAHGLPIVPVLAGLAHTRDHLDKHGISRLSEDAAHTLTPLPMVEAMESVAMFMAFFRARGSEGERDAWAEAIAADSQGWPQHLHVGLKAAASVLAANSGCLEPRLLKAARQDAAGRRWDYYRARTKPVMADTDLLLAEFMRRLGDGVPGRGEAADLIDRSVGVGRRRQLPRSIDAPDYVDALIRAGALHEASDRVFCPIPSLRDHLANRGRGRRQRANDQQLRAT